MMPARTKWAQLNVHKGESEVCLCGGREVSDWKKDIIKWLRDSSLQRFVKALMPI
jgi:hypothetical protein